MGTDSSVTIRHPHIDFSRTPAGHLLNLFADVVKQHDAGWFTADFVNDFHDAIRVELESRYIGAPIKIPPSPMSEAGWKLAQQTHLGPETEELMTPVDEPFTAAGTRLLLIQIEDGYGCLYQWVFPGHNPPCER